MQRSAWLHVDDCLAHTHLPYTSLAGIFVIVIVAILVSFDIIDIRIQLTHFPNEESRNNEDGAKNMIGTG